MRAQRALEEVGVVFPPEHNLDRTIGGYRIFKRAKQQAKEHMLPRGPTSFRVYRKGRLQDDGAEVVARSLSSVS